MTIIMVQCVNCGHVEADPPDCVRCVSCGQVGDDIHVFLAEEVTGDEQVVHIEVTSE